MRKYALSLILLQLMLAVQSYGQANIPTSATGPASATARKLSDTILYQEPSYFTRVYTPMKPITDTTLISLGSSPGDVNTITLYRDSYGRPIQSVVHKASPAGNDFVTPVYYDQYGNPSIQYLPFTSTTGNTNDGKFKMNPYKQDSTFYKAQFPNEQINYGQTLYDGSPANFPVKATAPGNSWTGAGVGISYSHRTNTVADSVKLWTIAISTENDVPSTTINYQAGTLLVMQTTDEKGNKTLTFKDGLGRTILTKAQVAASPGTGHYGWLCTYYVYDEMNHVRRVIPPKAVDSLNASTVNWNLTSYPAIDTGLCYSYFYDARGRALMKRIPGKGKIYIAYDLLDRVVMMQDANLRATSQWQFILYDGQSRPVETGLITSSLIKDSIQAQAARSSAYPTLSGTYTVNTQTYYDDYSWISGSGTSLTGSLVTTNINSTNFNLTYNATPDYAQPITQSNRIRGAVTGTKTIIVGSSTYLFSVNIYDDHGRNIQSSHNNYSGGTDIATVQYAFSSRILRTHLAHQKSGTNAQSHTLLTKYSYDNVGRIASMTKNLDNSTDKTICAYTYNELGQALTKTIGSSIETQNYSYNIRGWLLGINSGYVSTSGSTSNYFGESLSYDYGFTNGQLNGNIAGVRWKAGGDGIARAYGYAYDNTNRLAKADFTQQNQGSTSWTNDKVDYSVSGLNYDGNGNILSLKQIGLKLGSSMTIDSLTYQYLSNSNQLAKVSDGISDMSPLGDFKDTTLTGNDYTYDNNGNTNLDYNRHMVTSTNGPGAVYNFLNKPDSICLNGHAGIHYYYDASGNQLRKQINDYTPGASPAVKNYLYMAGFVYLNDTLQYILHEEGRIRYAKKTLSTNSSITYYAYEYDYFIKDHQGNVRTVLTEGRDTATYAATMETKDSAVVEALFRNVYDPVRTVYPKPSGFDSDTSNHNVSMLNASPSVNITTGPSLVLKVMAGDQVQISTLAYYNTAVQPPPGGINLLNQILPVLAGGVINNSSGKILAGDLTNLSNTLNPNVTNFLSSRSYDTTRPKAYLNWILFDDQFNYVSSNSGVQQVSSSSSAQALSPALQTMSKNGYLYVYVSNESQQPVYFDNLTVKQFSGPLSQEQSYYPFGVQMAGISDKQLLKQIAPYKSDAGTELEEDYGLNYYNTSYRKYDPQIGRFAGIDRLAEGSAAINPYQYGVNNPVMFNDPSGLVKEGIGYQAESPYFQPFRDNDLNSIGGIGMDGPWASYWNEILGALWSNGGGIFTPGANGSGGTYEFFGDEDSPPGGPSLVQIVQMLFEATWSGQVGGITAEKAENGFNFGYLNSSGQRFSVFETNSEILTMMRNYFGAIDFSPLSMETVTTQQKTENTEWGSSLWGKYTYSMYAGSVTKSGYGPLAFYSSHEGLEKKLSSAGLGFDAGFASFSGNIDFANKGLFADLGIGESDVTLGISWDLGLSVGHSTTGEDGKMSGQSHSFQSFALLLAPFAAPIAGSVFAF